MWAAGIPAGLMNLTSGAHTHTHTNRESVIVSLCVCICRTKNNNGLANCFIGSQRIRFGDKINLLPAQNAAAQISMPSVSPSVHSSVHPADPPSFVPPLVGEAWGFCVCKIAKLLPQPHAARTIYLIHIQISDNARSPPSYPATITPPPLALESRCGDCPMQHWQHLFAVQIYFYWIAKNWQPSSGGKSRAPFTDPDEPRTMLCGTRLPIVQIVETLCKFLYCFSLFLSPSLPLS